MNVVSCARALTFMSLVAAAAVAGGASAENGRDLLVDQVRAANARFNDVSVALAECYAPIPCASGVDGGAMGVHYVNPNYLKDAIPDLKRPQAVMYEPTPDGRIRIVEIVGLDRQACGGTHLSSTGDSPPIRILKIDNKGRHNRRVRIALADAKRL